MGKKYIIELEDKPFHKEDGDFLYRVKGFNSLVFDMTGIGMLTPYAAPDLKQVRKYAYKIGYEKGYRDGVNRIGDAEDKIRKEAYEDGYKTAKVQCNIQAEKDMREVGERHYQRGLSDAWEAARKICTNWVLSDSVLSEIFGMNKTIDDIMKESTASEAIEKIRQYEQEQEEINVGDEVGYYGVADEHGNVCYSGVVLEIKEDDYLVMEKNGKTYALKKKLVMSKTGRHFPEIAAVLEKMRGEQDG